MKDLYHDLERTGKKGTGPNRQPERRTVWRFSGSFAVLSLGWMRGCGRVLMGHKETCCPFFETWGGGTGKQEKVCHSQFSSSFRLFVRVLIVTGAYQI